MLYFSPWHLRAFSHSRTYHTDTLKMSCCFLFPVAMKRVMRVKVSGHVNTLGITWLQDTGSPDQDIIKHFYASSIRALSDVVPVRHVVSVLAFDLSALDTLHFHWSPHQSDFAMHDSSPSSSSLDRKAALRLVVYRQEPRWLVSGGVRAGCTLKTSLLVSPPNVQPALTPRQKRGVFLLLLAASRKSSLYSCLPLTFPPS